MKQPKGVVVMPNTAKSDADCIQSAYEVALAAIFTQFLHNLTGQPDGPGDQHYVTIFTAAYNAAKHAKALALGVVGHPAPTIATAAIKQRSVAKRKTRQPASASARR